MTNPKKIRLYLISISLVLFLTAGCRKKPEAQPDDKKTPAPAVKQQTTDKSDPQPDTKMDAEALQGYKNSTIPQNKEINSAVSEMIQLGAQWKPMLQTEWGKKAPDFTAADIEGNTHKLSDYIGKNVLIVKLATYDPGCQKQISHLNELQSTSAEEKLQILAISNEPIDKVKSFAAANNLNFSIIAGRTRMPNPYRSARHLPTSFYIDKDGLMKLAVQGVIPSQDSKKIIQTP